MALNKQTFVTRSLSASVFVLVLLSAVYFNYWIACAFFAIISCICFHEFGKLAEKLGTQVFKVGGYLLGGMLILLSLSMALSEVNSFIILHVFSLLSAIILGSIALFSKVEKPFHAACFTLFGIMYCFLPFSLLMQIPIVSKTLVMSDYQALTILGLVFLIWANDTFAYIGGSLIGKHKMFERVSPAKTWEGTLVGVICCIGVGFILNFAGIYKEAFIWPCIAAIVAVFGTIGDLTESLMKRQAGVKDSGTIMPGHGGALDRFDSLIVAAPVVFVFLKCLAVYNLL
jgi:phosphatidate cytidylyltransferase